MRNAISRTVEQLEILPPQLAFYRTLSCRVDGFVMQVAAEASEFTGHAKDDGVVELFGGPSAARSGTADDDMRPHELVEPSRPLMAPF
ncbi:hypothetical protein [Fodinicola acaciae]|uniref:hypothetical protein n=1 Tax=Fodinicola acaciae TaxID=2681555 RepID=UPI0013D88DA1|nr:hypothetical protein [Fodinicola acaciae]